MDLLREANVDSRKLKKLLDLSVTQADALIADYKNTKTIPALLAKSFLNGGFSGIVAHMNERDQRALQIEPLQKLVDNAAGMTPRHFINDFYLGRGNGIASRLALIEERKTKAENSIAKVSKVLHDCTPDILLGIADAIKKTSSDYSKLFDGLNKPVMAEVDALVKDLLSKAPGNGASKSAQPKSPDYPLLTDPENPLFMIPLLKDAQIGKERLDAFVVQIVTEIVNAEVKFAPLKSVERAFVKVFEKYDCRLDQLTDLARATIVCEDEGVLRSVMVELKKAVEDKAIQIHRIKHRLDANFDAMESGGYRDILVNMVFPPNDHVVELQLNLKAFVEIKNGGGHSSYSVGRMLQAFEPNATTYTGFMTSDSVRDIESGLTKKATVLGVDASVTEGRIAKSLASHGIQLMELKFLSIAFSGVMQNLDWLATSANELASTLKYLQIDSCGVKGRIPSEVGHLRYLTVLNLTDNKLEGALFRCDSL